MAKYSESLEKRIQENKNFLTKFLGKKGFEKLSDPDQFDEKVYFQGADKANPGGTAFYFAKKSLDKLRDLSGLGKDAGLDELYTDLKPKLVDVFNLFKLAHRELKQVKGGAVSGEGSEAVDEALTKANSLSTQLSAIKNARQLLVRSALKAKTGLNQSAVKKKIIETLSTLSPKKANTEEGLKNDLKDLLKGKGAENLDMLISLAFYAEEVDSEDAYSTINDAALSLEEYAKELNSEYDKSSGEVTSILKELGDEGKIEEVSIPELTNKVQDSALLKKFINVSKTFAPLSHTTIKDRASMENSIFKSSSDPEKAFDRMWARLYSQDTKHRETLSPDIRQQLIAIDTFFENLYLITKNMENDVDKAKAILESVPTPRVDLSATTSLKKAIDRAFNIFGEGLLDQHREDFDSEEQAQELKDFGYKVLGLLIPSSLTDRPKFSKGDSFPFHVPEFLSESEDRLKMTVARLSGMIGESLTKLDKEREAIIDTYSDSITALNKVNKIFNSGYQEGASSAKEHDGKAIGENIRATRNFYSNTVSKYPLFKNIIDNHSQMYGKHYPDEPSPKADKFEALRTKNANNKVDSLLAKVEKATDSGISKLEKIEDGLASNSVFDLMKSYHSKIKSLIEDEEKTEASSKKDNKLQKFMSGKVSLDEFDEFFKLLNNLTTFKAPDTKEFSESLESAFNGIVRSYSPKSFSEERDLDTQYSKFKAEGGSPKKASTANMVRIAKGLIDARGIMPDRVLVACLRDIAHKLRFAAEPAMSPKLKRKLERQNRSEQLRSSSYTSKWFNALNSHIDALVGGTYKLLSPVVEDGSEVDIEEFHKVFGAMDYKSDPSKEMGSIKNAEADKDIDPSSLSLSELLQGVNVPESAPVDMIKNMRDYKRNVSSASEGSGVIDLDKAKAIIKSVDRLARSVRKHKVTSNYFEDSKPGTAKDLQGLRDLLGTSEEAHNDKVTNSRSRIEKALDDYPELYSQAKSLIDNKSSAIEGAIEDYKAEEPTPDTKRSIKNLEKTLDDLTTTKRDLDKDPHAHAMDAFRILDKDVGLKNRKDLSKFKDQEAKNIANYGRSSRELLDLYLRYRNPKGFDDKYFESLPESKSIKSDLRKAIKVIDGSPTNSDKATDDQKKDYYEASKAVEDLKVKIRKSYPSLFSDNDKPVLSSLFTSEDSKKLESLKESVFKTRRRLDSEKSKGGDSRDDVYVSKKEKEIGRKEEEINSLEGRADVKLDLAKLEDKKRSSDLSNPTPKSALSKKLYSLMSGNTHLNASQAHSLVSEVTSNPELSDGLKKSVETYVLSNTGAGDKDSIKESIKSLSDDGSVADMISGVKIALKDNKNGLLDEFNRLVEDGSAISASNQKKILDIFSKASSNIAKSKFESGRTDEHNKSSKKVEELDRLKGTLESLKGDIDLLLKDNGRKKLKKDVDKATSEYIEHLEGELKDIDSSVGNHKKTIEDSESGHIEVKDSEIDKINKSIEDLTDEKNSIESDLKDYSSDMPKLVKDSNKWHKSEFLKNRDLRLHEESNPSGSNAEDTSGKIKEYRDSEKHHFKKSEILKEHSNRELTKGRSGKYDSDKIGDLDIAEKFRNEDDAQGSQFLSKTMRVPLKRGAHRDMSINVFDPSTSDQIFMNKWSQMSMDKVKSGSFPTSEDFDKLVNEVYTGYLERNIGREYSEKGLTEKIKSEKEKNDYWKGIKKKYSELSKNIEQDVPPVLKAMGKAYREIQNEMEDAADNMEEYSTKINELADKKEEEREDKPDVGLRQEVDFERMDELLTKSEEGSITDNESKELDKIISKSEAKDSLADLVNRFQQSENVKNREVQQLQKVLESRRTKEAGGSDDAGLMGDLDPTDNVTHEDTSGGNSADGELDDYAKKRHLKSNPSLREQGKVVNTLKSYFKKLQAGKGSPAKTDREKKTQYTHAQDFVNVDAPEIKSLSSSIGDLNKLIKSFKFDDRFRSSDDELSFASSALDRSHSKSNKLKSMRDEAKGSGDVGSHEKLNGKIDEEKKVRQDMIRNLHGEDVDSEALLSEMVSERDRILEKSKKELDFNGTKVTYGQLGETVSQLLDIYLELRAKIRSMDQLADKEIDYTDGRIYEYGNMLSKAKETGGSGLSDTEMNNFKNVYLSNMWKRIEHIWLSNLSSFQAQYNMNFEDWKKMFAMAKDKFGVMQSPRLSNQIKFISEVIEGQNPIRFGPTRASAGRSKPDWTPDELVNPKQIESLKKQKDEIYKLMYAFESAEFARRSINDLIKKTKGDSSVTKTNVTKKSFEKQLNKLMAEIDDNMKGIDPELKKDIDAGKFEVKNGAAKEAGLEMDPDFNSNILYGKRMQDLISKLK